MAHHMSELLVKKSLTQKSFERKENVYEGAMVTTE